MQDFEGGNVRFGDVSNKDSLRSTAFRDPIDVVVSCLASRTGGKVRVMYAPCTALMWTVRPECVQF